MPDINTGYSELDASNNNPAPNGMPEGMAPSGVNDSWRAGVGAITRAIGRIWPKYTTTGSAGAYVWTPTNTSFPTTYSQGEIYSFKANFTSVGADTLNVNGLGAKPLYKTTSGTTVAVAQGDIIANQMVMVAYDSALNTNTGGFQLLSATAPATGIVGTMRNLKFLQTTTTTAVLTADEVIVEGSIGGAAYKVSNISSLTLNITTTGANGMDTGSPPVAGDLSIYLIYNPSTGTAALLATLGSTSNGNVYSGSNLPSGYTASALVSSVITVASHISFAQIDRTVFTRKTLGNNIGSTQSLSNFTMGVGFSVPNNAKSFGGMLIPAGGSSMVITAASDINSGFIATSGSTQTPFALIPLTSSRTIGLSNSSASDIISVTYYTF